MAAAATRTRRTAAKPKAAPIEEPEELDEELEETEDGDEDELEVLEEDEVTEDKPASKKASAVADVTFGIRDLVAEIKRATGKETDPRSIRTLIRKMARDGSGRVDREIKAGNRSRYDWSGPNDPEVVAIVKAFEGGELDAEKKAKLDALKEQKAKKALAKKAAAAEVEEDDAEETEEAPKPTRRRTAAKTTAAKPATRRRKPAPVEQVVEDDEELDLDEDE